MRSSAFVSGRREVILESGTLLFSIPEGAGGGKVRVGAITAAVTGTDFLVSRNKKGIPPSWTARTHARGSSCARPSPRWPSTWQPSQRTPPNSRPRTKTPPSKTPSLAAKVANVDAKRRQANASCAGRRQPGRHDGRHARRPSRKWLTSKRSPRMCSPSKPPTWLTSRKISPSRMPHARKPRRKPSQQTSATQEAAKLDTKLDALTQGAAQQEVAAQKITELTSKVAAAQPSDSQQLTGTQDAAKRGRPARIPQAHGRPARGHQGTAAGAS